MSLRKIWNETVEEGIPDEFQELLDKLPCLSDESAEAGDAVGGESYSAGQDIRH